MDLALKSEKSLQHGEGIDNYMPTDDVLEYLERIDQSRQREIDALNSEDAEYSKKVKQINARAKHTKFKVMKKLNGNNE